MGPQMDYRRGKKCRLRLSAPRKKRKFFMKNFRKFAAPTTAEKEQQAEPEMVMIEIKVEPPDAEADTYREQAGPEIETVEIKIKAPDHETYTEQVDPVSDTLEVHTAPADDHTHNLKQNFLLIDAGKIIIRHENKEQPEEYAFHDSKQNFLLIDAGKIIMRQENVKKQPEEYTLHESDIKEDIKNEDPVIKIEEIEFTEEPFT